MRQSIQRGLFGLCLVTTGVLADDASNGQFGLGFGLQYGQTPYSDSIISNLVPDWPIKPEFTVWGSYYFNNGIFWETPKTNEFGFSNLILGYELWQNDVADLSLIHTLVEPLPIYDYERKNGDLVSLDRLPSFTLGTRMQASIEGVALSATVSLDPFYTGGVHSKLKLGYPVRLGNWYSMPAVSARLTSQALNQAFIGIDATRPSLDFLPPYRASATLDWAMGVGATYPISQNWLLDLYAEQVWYDQGFRNSPLVQDIEHALGSQFESFSAGAMLSYVW